MNEEYLRHLFDREYDINEMWQKEKRAKEEPQSTEDANVSLADIYARIELYGKELAFIKQSISLYIKLHSK